MLTKLGQRGYMVRDAAGEYGDDKVESDIDPDTDIDSDGYRNTGDDI